MVSDVGEIVSGGLIGGDCGYGCGYGVCIWVCIWVLNLATATGICKPSFCG